MKDLPNVFKNNNNKSFTNNKSVYYSTKKEEVNSIRSSSKNVLQKINDIFASPNYVYKANVEISLKDKRVTKRIIGRNKDFLITMDNTLIPIRDIVDIKSVKK